MSEAQSSNHVVHLREVADRLRIRGDYGPGWADVADATACTIGAAEIERLNKRIEELERERTAGR